MKNNTLSVNGLYFEFQPDFEVKFDIKQFERDYESRERKHKPYHAFKQSFEINGDSKEEELEVLNSNTKLKQLFSVIYNQN